MEARCTPARTLISTPFIAGLCASRVAASISPLDESVATQTTADAFVSSEPLAKADKLIVVADLPAVEATSSLPPDPPAVPAITPKAAEIAPMPATPKAGRTIAILPKPRPKIRLSKDSTSTTIVDVKSCARPDGLVGMFATLSGSIDCG